MFHPYAPRAPLPSRFPHPFRYKTTGGDVMRLYVAVLRPIVDQQFFIIRICRCFSARGDARKATRGRQVMARIQNNAANFLSVFPRIKGSPLFTCASVRSSTTSEINCHRIVEWNRYWNTEKSLILQTLIKRHDNPRTRCWEANGERGENQRGFIPDEAAEAQAKLIQPTSSPCGSIDSPALC